MILHTVIPNPRTYLISTMASGGHAVRSIKLHLAGSLKRVEFHTCGSHLELHEKDLVLSLHLAEGTIHVRLIDFDGVMRTQFWPSEEAGMGMFRLPL